MNKGWKICGVVGVLTVVAVSGAAILLAKAFKDLDNLTWPEDLTVEERAEIAKKQI